MSEAPTPIESTKGFSNSLSRRFGGVLAIGGGVAGIGTIVSTALTFNDTSSFLLVSVGLLFYAFGVRSGVRLFEGAPKASRDFERFLWIQVPIVQTGVLTYFFASLASLSLVWHGGQHFEFVVAPLGGFTFSLFSIGPKSGIGINFLPIIAAITFRVINAHQKRLV